MLRKLRKFDPGLITREFFPQHLSHPEDINHGQCFVWSYVGYKLFEDVELWDLQATWSHAFLYHRGTKKFYDSETLNGVKDWREFPCSVICLGGKDVKAGERKLSNFFYDWHESKERHDISWRALDQKVEKLLRNADPYMDALRSS